MIRLPIKCPACDSPHYEWAEKGKAACVKCRNIYHYDAALDVELARCRYCELPLRNKYSWNPWTDSHKCDRWWCGMVAWARKLLRIRIRVEFI